MICKFALRFIALLLFVLAFPAGILAIATFPITYIVFGITPMDASGFFFEEAERLHKESRR